MKTKIDVRKIKAIFIALVLLSVSAAGWILFVRSEIHRQKDMTREISLQTEEILNQMQRRDSAFTAEYHDLELPEK